MRKILYCASTLSHIRNFHLPYLKAFHNLGYEVWVLANEEGAIPYADHVVALPFAKSLLSLQNVKAIFLARTLLKEERFEFVSTHTALASAVVRAAISLLRNRPKVFCTVHGYLFNENDGLKKWVYLLPEKICAHVTDILMVMNQEDYEIAQKHKLSRNKPILTHGMGIDLEKFPLITLEKRESARSKFGFSPDDFLFIYAAEFSKRKNQIFLIRVFSEACREHPNMKLILAGNGALLKECKDLAEQLHVEKQIVFPGHVKPIQGLYATCDAGISSSQIEGLPFNIMEMMSCGLPVIASNIKGHRELIKEGETGWLYHSGDSAALREKIIYLYMHTQAAKEVGRRGRKLLKSYELEAVFEEIITYYK